MNKNKSGIFENDKLKDESIDFEMDEYLIKWNLIKRI